MKIIVKIISHKVIGNYHLWFVQYNDESYGRIRILEPDNGKEEIKEGDSYESHKEDVYK